MRIAIPISEGKLDPHFGHCKLFSLVDVSTDDKKILDSTFVQPPLHEPGILPAWIADHGANLVLAGGMGGKAIQLFKAHGIEVIVGAPCEAPEAVVQSYLDGKIGDGLNACDH
jgi:predicted Fe-Mo cluster-binding NifX family protein